MDDQLHFFPYERVLRIAPRSVKAPTLQPDIPDNNNSLDGSVEALNRFLQELVEMTGQGSGADSVPVLELVFGDITTMTSLSIAGDAACLSITALLPRKAQTDYQPLSSVPVAMSVTAEREYECLWHADEGRYVMVRRIPIENLRDERTVMDAVLDTSDQAAKWFNTVVAYLKDVS